MSEAGEHRPAGWAKRIQEEGVPAWAIWQAWNEADDEDTVGQIRARAIELAAKP